ARQFRYAPLVDAERLGPAAHLHPRAAQLEIRIDANGEARSNAEALADRQRTASLAGGFEVEGHALADRQLQLAVALARAGEADHPRVLPRRDGQLQLSGRSDVEPVDQSSHQLEDRPIRICF